MKTALITGITGQDGSYLAELLLSKGYRVVGMIRRPLSDSTHNILQVVDRIEFVNGDITDVDSLTEVVAHCSPDEVYNLAGLTSVRASWEDPIAAGDATGLGLVRLLEAVRQSGQPARVFQASSAEMFGIATMTPQREVTPLNPISPYGIAKTFAHQTAEAYRQRYGMYVASGILFNHESPRRSPEFFPRRVSLGVARISLGLQEKLTLGNLEARRDWGYAGDFVRAMWLMLQNREPRDYVIATGQSHSCQDFVDVAFRHVGLQSSRYISVDPHLLRSADILCQLGDASLAHQDFGWYPEVLFEDLVKMMVDADLESTRAR